ncbi:RNA binding motif protein 12Ba [Aplochiton taeniatus]
MLNLRSSENAENSKPGYVRLYGLSTSVTKQDICNFFKGLQVEEVIVNVKLGHGRCCLVKFADIKNANDALRFDHLGLGSSHVDVRGASEKMWMSAVRECADTSNKHQEVLYIPSESQYRTQRRPSSDSWGDTTLHKSHTATYTHGSQEEVCTKRPIEDPSLTQSPKRSRSDSKSTPDLQAAVEYCIMVKNLSPGITKTEIKELFRCQNIQNNKILHLLDIERMRTDTAFVIFNQSEDYVYAMSLNGYHVGSKAIAVSTVTRDEMQGMLHFKQMKEILNIDR